MLKLLYKLQVPTISIYNMHVGGLLLFFIIYFRQINPDKPFVAILANGCAGCKVRLARSREGRAPTWRRHDDSAALEFPRTLSVWPRGFETPPSDPPRERSLLPWTHTSDESLTAASAGCGHRPENMQIQDIRMRRRECIM